MADIFGYDRTTAADVFVADRSRLTIVGVEGTDLIQSWSIQYTQSIQPIYEVARAGCSGRRATRSGRAASAASSETASSG